MVLNQEILSQLGNFDQPTDELGRGQIQTAVRRMNTDWHGVA